jgi:phosphatidylglycerophosphate synthase
MALAHTWIAQTYYRLMDRVLLDRLARSGLGPNGLTLAGTGLAAAVPLGCWIGPGAGFLLMLLSGAADSLDGRLARTAGRESAFGAFLDSTADRVSDFCYLCGIWVLFWTQASGRPWATLLVFSGFLLAALVSYTKARIEGLGGECHTGLLDRAPRTIYILAWLLALALLPQGEPVLLWAGMGVFWALSLVTVVQRIRSARRQLG